MVEANFERRVAGSERKEKQSMEIAPGVEHVDWRQLDLDNPHSPDWDKAIGILESRLRGRFLDVVDFLIETVRGANGAIDLWSFALSNSARRLAFA